MGFCLCAGLILALAVQPAATQEMPKPGPEHEMLKKFEGNWNATVSFAGGESKGTASYKMDLGGFWLRSHFKSDLGGMPFEGRGITTFDPRKKKYVGAWADSMAPQMLVMEGTFSKDGSTYTETSEGAGMDGKNHKMKMVHEFKGKDTIVFTMYQADDGKDQEMMKITYKRKKK
jgi:hypothetical protein